MALLHATVNKGHSRSIATILPLEVFQFSDRYDPEADDFQNLTGSTLSIDISLVKFTRRSDQ